MLLVQVCSQRGQGMGSGGAGQASWGWGVGGMSCLGLGGVRVRSECNALRLRQACSSADK